jgi:hypothetical protein
MLQLFQQAGQTPRSAGVKAEDKALNPSVSSASRGAAGEMKVGQTSRSNPRRSQSRRRHRRLQGSRLQRCHEAAQLCRPAATHGVKKVHRHMGGTGALRREPRWWPHEKGQRCGNARITAERPPGPRDKENNLLLINGSVPGPNGGYVVVQETNKVG